MSLPKISKEQNEIVKNLEKNNIIVDSVAGSGKTTTSLYITKHFKNKQILLLTYNAKLKMETRKKVKTLKIKNLEVHSYHSFCVKYYNYKCNRDTGIKNIIVNNIACKEKFSYDIFILDEAQDITDLYYELMCKINNDNLNNAKFCLLGDKHQSIYHYNNADERYITYAEQLFNFNKLPWKKCSLKFSFRVTNKIADFINNCMLKCNRIKTIKKSLHKPKYIICDVFANENTKSSYKPYVEINRFFKLGYKPNDIFILAPSLKTASCPVRSFENFLKINDPSIPIYVPISDEEKLDEKVVKNKLVFSTYHQIKGLERKVVFVFGFDSSYFKYYNKEKNNPSKCPNELYVATTRAQEHLVLFHHHNNNYLQFLNKEKLKHYAIVNGNISDTTYKNKTKIQVIQVTQLIRHLPYNVIDQCFNYLTIKHIKKIGDMINIPCKIKNKIKNKSLSESVSNINGIAIPSFFEYKKTGKITILNHCINSYKSESETETEFEFDFDLITDNIKKFLKKHIKNLKNIKKKQSIKKNLLYISTIYDSLTSGYIFKSFQITDFNWLSNDMISKSLKRFELLKISKKATFESPCNLSNDLGDVPEILNKKIIGCFDCFDGKNIYEFKCTKKLEKEHYLQLAIYMYIFKILRLRYKNRIDANLNILDKFRPMHYLLYNILTGQLDEISCNLTKLKEMIKYLFDSKFNNKKTITDDVFKNKMMSIKKKYEKLDVDKKYKLFIDLETSGLPERLGFDMYYNPKETKYYKHSRIVEIGYLICDNNGKIIKKVTKIIKPNKFTITNSKFHGITNKIANEKGVKIDDVFKILRNDLDKIDTIVSHNLSFDINILLSECYRNGKNKLAKKIESKKTECTMKLGQNVMKIRKYPKLTELYKYLFNKNINQKHRALSDVIQCKDCYYKIKG